MGGDNKKTLVGSASTPLVIYKRILLVIYRTLALAAGEGLLMVGFMGQTQSGRGVVQL